VPPFAAAITANKPPKRAHERQNQRQR
jgi:hypothetical protein